MALWTATITMSFAVPVTIPGIIGYILPLSASDALNGPPRGAHQLGFWLLFLPSLPLWLAGLWLTTLAAVKDRLSRGQISRRTVWCSASAFTLLAVAAAKNILGFGDVFSPV
jgi:hypothetical protein